MASDTSQTGASPLDARLREATASLDRGRNAEGEQVMRAVLALAPDHAGATHLLGVALMRQEKVADALPWLRKAAAMRPDDADTLRNLGDALLIMGEVAQARAAFVRALDLGPWRIALHNVVSLTRMDADSAEVSDLWRRLRELQARSDLTTDERILLNFSLGKAHAVAAWAEGCRLKRATMTYSIEPTLARWREIARAVDRSALERLAGSGTASDRPIFICGLPRSGTTLVEQILSAHPQVFGGGELAALPRVVASVRTPDGKAWPHWFGALRPMDYARIGQAYLDQLPRTAPGQTRVVDKRLENVETLGLIDVCLPKAAMIYVRRDPRDVAFSCWTSLFGWGHAFTYDMDELVAYIAANEALMDHWRAILPPGRLLEVPYEALVADPETWTRRIVAHCGLDWDDACLAPQDAKRPVMTISLAQVRQPVHAGAVGRWKPYARALAPLFEPLADLA
jgi:tetratricopeptide (TPR) repeat protein